MKKTIFVAVFALLAAACSNDCNDDEVEKPVEGSDVTAKVTVHVNDFSIVMESLDAEVMTRSAENPATYKSVGAIDLVLFDADGKNVYSKTQFKKQTSTYTTFGEFTCDLPVGHYTMVVIGRGYFDGDAFTLTSPTSAGYTSERARETFVAKQNVTVTSSAPLNLNVTLSRIVSSINIISTDGRSTGVAKIRTTYAKGSKSFNPSTGFATDDAGFVLTNTPSAAIGSPINVSSFVFLATDEEKMNITIEVLDASNNVLFTKVVENVPLKRNRKTTLTGAMFTAPTSAASFKVETSWLDGNSVSF